MDELRFGGKVALITGAGSGIGRAVAQRLAAEGARVFGHDIDDGSLAETTALIAARCGDGAVQMRAGDVSSRDECAATVAACVGAFGRLDVLGNIAGVAACEHFTSVSEAGYRRLMAVNVDGPFFMAQAAVPHLLESGGNIVNIASNAGLMGMAYNVAYSMSKGAVVQLTRSLAMEYVKTPLRVNAIAPGGVRTNLTKQFQIPADVDFELMKPYTGFRGAAEADEIAALFAFVASDDATSLHGAIVSSDGGITAG